MTAITFIVCFFLGLAYYLITGETGIHGSLTIYTATYIATTGIAALYCFKSKDRSNCAAGCCIIGYVFIAPWVYYYPNALLWGAVIYLFMAFYFIALGTRRFEIYAGLLFLLAVAVTALSASGIIPSHITRPSVFIAFSQPDIVAICGHAANIIIGFSAGDGGHRARDYLSSRLLAGDFSRGLGFVLFSNVQAEKEGAK